MIVRNEGHGVEMTTRRVDGHPEDGWTEQALR
jgi:hypothetical protein